jgi:hypothetical protein
MITGSVVAGAPREALIAAAWLRATVKDTLVTLKDPAENRRDSFAHDTWRPELKSGVENTGPVKPHFSDEHPTK